MVQRVVPERPWEKSRITLWTTVTFILATSTGIVLLGVEGANSGIGMWHYRIGLTSSALMLIHISKRFIPLCSSLRKNTNISIHETNHRHHSLEPQGAFRILFPIRRSFFGITTLVDFTKAYEHIKAHRRPFFLSSVHFLLKCVNETEAFRLRTEDGKLVQYDTIHVSPTIGREDGTFGFGFFEYHTDIDIFIRNAEKEIKRVKKGCGLSVTENTWRPDVIRYSALPWFAFSEMKHAGSIRTGDSVPRISTGKLTQENGRYNLPLSITVHHGLMDGRNVAELLQKIEYHQKLL